LRSPSWESWGSRYFQLVRWIVHGRIASPDPAKHERALARIEELEEDRHIERQSVGK
jgi:hypothetical protein